VREREDAFRRFKYTMEMKAEGMPPRLENVGPGKLGRWFESTHLRQI
jgi:hypothetical protein